MSEPAKQIEPLTACPICGCGDLFVRKAFPQKLGLLVVFVAAIAFLALSASRTRFQIGIAVLLGAVIVDAVLYLIVPKTTVCYRCRAEFRGAPLNPNHGAFELPIAEKYRSQGGNAGR